MPVHRRVSPALSSLLPVYTPGWRETQWEFKCLAQEHNTISPVRAQTPTAQCREELTNYETTAWQPLTKPNFLSMRRVFISFLEPNHNRQIWQEVGESQTSGVGPSRRLWILALTEQIAAPWDENATKPTSFHLWPFIGKHVLSSKPFSGGLRSFWNPLETLMKGFETLRKPLWISRNALKAV